MSTIIDGTTGITFPDASTQAKAVSQVTPFAVTASAIAGAELQLPEATANGVNYVALKAPNTLAANTTFTLPAADGTNGQYLQTNGSGTLAFASVPATTPGGTTGQVQINSAGAFGAVSSGTVGQVLTSGGAGVAPSFATPATGALVFISSQTVSGSPASVDFTSGINSTYDDYLITFENLQFTTVGGNNAALTVRLQQSGSFQTGSTYDYSNAGVAASAAEVDAGNNQTRMIVQGGRNNTFGDATRSGFLYLLNVNSTASRGCSVLTISTSRASTAATSQTSTGGGTSSVAAAVTGIQFLSNNAIVMTSGTFRLYGIAKS
jgi:hypothetical protein